MKKTYPLAVLQAIVPIIEKAKDSNMSIVKDSALILRVEDPDSDSTFFYEITQYFQVQGNSGLGLKIRHKPANSINIEEQASNVSTQHVLNSFNGWFNLIAEYDTVSSVFDEPILKQYKEEFFQEFVSADENADSSSFTLPQQFWLDEAVSKIVHTLKEYKTEKNESVMNVIIDEAESIKEDIGNSTKEEVFSRLSSLFAIIRKGSITWLKETYPAFMKELLSQSIKASISVATDLLK